VSKLNDNDDGDLIVTQKQTYRETAIQTGLYSGEATKCISKCALETDDLVILLLNLLLKAQYAVLHTFTLVAQDRV